MGADLAVIPECSENAIPPSDEFISFLWKGHNPKKGLGIIAFNEWQLQLRDDLEPLPWVIPFKAWLLKAFPADIRKVCVSACTQKTPNLGC